MTTETATILAGLFFGSATLYASVGHAGASAYLAVMSLMSVEPGLMKPTALILNIFVATIGTIQFCRAGCFSWSLFWPLACASAPAAYLGGATTLQSEHYKLVVGFVLLVAAVRMFQSAGKKVARPLRTPHRLLLAIAGAAIAFVSGMTGTGGGIFLTPLLLFAGWADTRTVLGISVSFILVNSIAGLAGSRPEFSSLPTQLPVWIASVILGGLLGTYLGAKRLSPLWLRRLLSVVLLIAALKLLLT